MSTGGCCKWQDFNPRSREGSDSDSASAANRNRISIHAPVKGATRICLTSAPHPIYFNPRSREGSDAFLRRPASCPPTFQSTLPRRERRLYAVRHYQRCAISIHAPGKGATLSCAVRQAVRRHFNPRSREGSDGSTPSDIISDVLFQSTLPGRERRRAIRCA